MAYIKTRKKSDGSTRYTAIVRIRKGKQIVHQEARTFMHRTAAASWAKHREVILENPTALVREQHGAPTLAELIRWYIDSFEKVSKWQRSKQSHLEFLENHDIGKANALALTAAMLVDHIRSRRAHGAGPATAANDLIWIGVVLRAAKSVDGIPVDPQIVEEARIACRELRLIAKSRRRERRPTPDELHKLHDHFKRRDRRAQIPMGTIMDFAIESARRQAEICRLEWTDNDPRTRSGMVRDAKHPTHKEGNHRRFKYTPEAWAIVERQPKAGEYIFPYNAKSIGAAFTRACKLIGIVNLCFHDLRHEGTSRLFERGYQIHEVAQFTLHESWNELKRYANLRPEKVREIPLSPPAVKGEAAAATQRRKARSRPAPSHAVDRSAPRGRPRLPATAISARPA